MPEIPLVRLDLVDGIFILDQAAGWRHVWLFPYGFPRLLIGFRFFPDDGIDIFPNPDVSKTERVAVVL